MTAPRYQRPGPKGWPYFGVIPFLVRDVLGYFETLRQRYGDVVFFNIAEQSACLVTDPEAIAEVFQQEKDGSFEKTKYHDLTRAAFGEGVFTTKGTVWKEKRRRLQPHFSRRTSTAWCGIVARCTNEMLARWQPNTTTGAPIDLADEMAYLTHSTISQLLFGVALNRKGASKVIAAFDTISRHLLNSIFRSMVFGGVLNRLDYSGRRRLRMAIEVVDDAINRLMKAKPKCDFVPLLTTLRGAGEDGDCHSLSEKEIRDELVTLLFAGQDTTASALTWTLHHVLDNQEASESIRAEAELLLVRETPTPDSVAAMSYCHSVVKEGMRLSPPVYAMSRTASRDVVIRGSHIPKGTLVVISPYVNHHNPAAWSAPSQFNTARFAPCAPAHPRFAFFPFGGGMHACLGQHFATTEMTIVLGMIMQDYNLRRASENQVVAETSLTLHPKHDLHVHLVSRAGREINL